jgi:hypothetical protein
MKNMEDDGRRRNLYGEKDIQKPNILDIEYYMDKNAREIVDFLEKKTVEDYAPTGEIYDRLLSQLVNEFPFGPEDGKPYYDKTHVILANALTSSLWCGWLSQEMVNKKEPKFKEEYLKKFLRAIRQAYVLGRKYANAQKLNKQ